MPYTHARVDPDDLVAIEIARPGDLDRQAMVPHKPAVRFYVHYENRPDAFAVPSLLKTVFMSWAAVEIFVEKLFRENSFAVIIGISRIEEEAAPSWAEKLGQYTRYYGPTSTGQ